MTNTKNLNVVSFVLVLSVLFTKVCLATLSVTQTIRYLI